MLSLWSTRWNIHPSATLFKLFSDTPGQWGLCAINHHRVREPSLGNRAWGPRADPERSPNEPQTDPERTLNGLQTNPVKRWPDSQTWCRDEYSDSTENFKRPKNRDDSSDLDEDLTGSNAAHKTFIEKSFPHWEFMLEVTPNVLDARPPTRCERVACI